MAFDDDDNPTAAASAVKAGKDNAATTEEALEDGVPDFKLFQTMFQKRGVSSKNVRKGEKDFEAHGTQAQDRALEASRQAMEDALDYTRLHKRDSWVRAWYFPDRWIDATDKDMHLRDRVVVVEVDKGGWLKDIGRIPTVPKGVVAYGKTWLLPEEALFLIERESIDLWWPHASLEELLPSLPPDEDADADAAAEAQVPADPDNYDIGLPLSLQAAYALLVGNEGERGKVSLAKYQVYAYLKRAGFYLQRAPLNSPRPDPPPQQPKTLWQWLYSLTGQDRQPHINLHGPLVSPGLYRSYKPVYQQLAVMDRHNPRVPPSETSEPEEPYRVFYHVFKTGGAPFTKRSPPPPDYRVAVAGVDESALPDLEQITALLESTPYDPPKEEWKGPGNRMYQRLKHGHRNVLVAVVDRGLVNFMRFGEGAFGEENMSERFDNKGPTRGGKMGRGGRGRGGSRGRGGRRGR